LTFSSSFLAKNPFGFNKIFTILSSLRYMLSR
jgi:hypothetical protein